MIVRPEVPADYADIASLHARAFGNRAYEALVVTLQRQRRRFDPELSLVAEDAGQIVGHVLFSPHTMRLLEQDVRAVNLAPIAVEPSRQGQGIGGRLIETGHEVAAAKGYTVSLLLGHPTYYPRFGYRTRAYGSAQLGVAVPELSTVEVERRAPTAEDVPALQELWRQDEGAVDFALEPGPDLLDWLSPNPLVEATVYLQGGVIAGYTRIHRAEPVQPRVFLSSSPEAARAMAGSIATSAGSPAQLLLVVHPSSISAQAFSGATIDPWEAAMARGLRPGPLDEYFELVDSGQRPAGRPTWPVAFDLE